MSRAWSQDEKTALLVSLLDGSNNSYSWGAVALPQGRTRGTSQKMLAELRTQAASVPMSTGSDTTPKTPTPSKVRTKKEPTGGPSGLDADEEKAQGIPGSGIATPRAKQHSKAHNSTPSHRNGVKVVVGPPSPSVTVAANAKKKAKRKATEVMENVANDMRENADEKTKWRAKKAKSEDNS